MLKNKYYLLWVKKYMMRFIKIILSNSGVHPTKLSKSITGRLPIRYDRNPIMLKKIKIYAKKWVYQNV